MSAPNGSLTYPPTHGFIRGRPPYRLTPWIYPWENMDLSIGKNSKKNLRNKNFLFIFVLRLKQYPQNGFYGQGEQISKEELAQDGHCAAFGIWCHT